MAVPHVSNDIIIQSMTVMRSLLCLFAGDLYNKYSFTAVISILKKVAGYEAKNDV